MITKTCFLLVFCISFLAHPFCQTVTDSITQENNFHKKPSTKQERREAGEKVKLLLPPEGKAMVFIVRPTIMAYAVPMRLDCDSFQVGWINAKTFLYTILDPGMHTFKSLSENEFHLDVNLEAGKTYYIEQEIRMGFAYARTKLKLLKDDQVGKKELGKCSISGSNRYPQFPLSRDVEKSPPRD